MVSVIRAREQQLQRREMHIDGDDGQTKGNRFYVILRLHSREFCCTCNDFV